MAVAQIMEDKLRQALAPSHLRIDDDSHRHAGHAGARAGGESHFIIEIVSARFSGLRPVARQRLVYEVLKDEMAGPVHALSLVTRAPEDVS